MEKPRLTAYADADDGWSPTASESEPPFTTAEDMDMENTITIDKYEHIDDDDDDDDDDTISNDAAPPAQGIEQTDVAPKREGLKLSQIETDIDPQDKAKDADVEASGASQAQVTSSITVVSNGTVDGAADLESGTGRETGEAAAAYFTENDSETENSAIAALENEEKSFPQILHEILATTECQSILHWLPGGFSFLIVDKQRFSSEILPQYFRGALLNSFIRKLNRWGFRRVKSRSKGEESSFAHRNFVRDKPWLCMKMRCKSKPTYHKVPSASADKMKKNTKKKKAEQHCTETTEASDSKSLATPAFATADIVVSAKAPPPFLATNGTDNGAFVPTFARTTVSEHEPLPLPNPHRNPTLNLPKAPPVDPARFPSTAGASTMQERQREHQHQHLAYHQQRIFHERQILIAQMRRRHQLQVELQRLNQMSSQIGEQIASSRAAQRAILAKYARERDMLRSSHNYHRGGRK